MAKIILFGGHGRVALHAEPLLVKGGNTVTAVIRNPEHVAEVRETGAEPLVADIETLDVDALAGLISGHDAVVWSAGAGGGDPTRTLAVDRDAAIRTMEAAERAGVRRYVMVSYFNASPDHGIDPSNSFYAYAEAKSAADAHLRDSSLEWTILGPSTLTFDSGSGRIDTGETESGRVSRENVAQVIAATLADTSTIRRTIRFNDGDTPVAEAISA
ncbi:SDR family oxidoreductase [Leucobacter soli]|uniref:Sugar epimerase YhfK n=1 Tax=Leucobacter soli TaxID=2812850 RepID=A0A916NWW7_9MICO|nr:SDR family oxidoreductase [Leucobacter soli]CAG7620392.1 putative sugar epimerase YhfK [Leucobacter soli]